MNLNNPMNSSSIEGSPKVSDASTVRVLAEDAEINFRYFDSKQWESH